MREQPRPGLVAPEGLQTQPSPPPWPDFKTGQSAGTDTRILPAARVRALLGLALPSTVAHFDPPSAAGDPADRPSCWATISPHAGALQQLEYRAPLLRPGVRASRCQAGFPPSPCPAAAGSRRSFCATAAPASRLRGRPAFGVRPLAGAVEERRCARRATAPALSSQPLPCLTLVIAHPTTLTCRSLASTPARGAGVPEQATSA